MALTADTLPETAEREVLAGIVLNAQVIFAGALCGVDGNGFVANWADTTGFVFAGTALEPATGDTAASPAVEIKLNCSGPVYKKVPVTGSTGQTDCGALVFATDENTFDLSTTTNVKAVGTVTRYYSGTTCDVRLFTPSEYQALN
jgi:hypothetical protein